ncbi:hypothetical protein DFH08DRAFT_814107 [Mycena albidolilacea]|uniref:Uncharacterized protein n=1 Tax=Mycena albidolilacea TaxID=1033008 RepID=A0AAD6ZR79_9AGAR|nr:hypothetical protein DFH08DRAFT_814107 [Mycena albidolilacea]
MTPEVLSMCIVTKEQLKSGLGEGFRWSTNSDYDDDDTPAAKKPGEKKLLSLAVFQHDLNELRTQESPTCLIRSVVTRSNSDAGRVEDDDAYLSTGEFDEPAKCPVWDISMASPFPHPAQEATGPPKQPVQPHWDDLISSDDVPTAGPPGPAARFTVNWSVVIQQFTSRLGGPFLCLRGNQIMGPKPKYRLFILCSVIAPCDGIFLELTSARDNSAPALGSRNDPAEEAPDIDAQLGWEWRPSDLKRLDSGVSSEIVEFPQGVKVQKFQQRTALSPY